MNKLILPMALAIALSGCATSARVDQMTARKIEASKIASDAPLKGDLSLGGVSRGTSTSPSWNSRVGEGEFRQALEQSLSAVRLLASDQDKASYVLSAALVRLERPLIGLDLKVTADVDYSVEERSTGRKVFSKTVSSSFTGTFSDAALAFERLKIANEGAVRENIEELVDELLSLNVPKQQVLVK